MCGRTKPVKQLKAKTPGTNNMPFFKKNTLADERLSAIDGLQLGADQVTEGSRFLSGTWARMKQEGVHPWHANDVVLFQMAYAAIALANDRTAEILRENCVTTHRKKSVMSPDATDFALGLSSKATELMNASRQMMPSQNVVEFDDETRAGLAAESMVPYWPRTTIATPVESWQGDDAELVTKPFLLAILAAGRELESYSALYANDLCNPAQTNAEVPPEYASMGTVLSELRASAKIGLDGAENILVIPMQDKIPTPNLHLAYGFLHRGFIVMMDSLVATACPPVLGEQFLPERE